MQQSDPSQQTNGYALRTELPYIILLTENEKYILQYTPGDEMGLISCLMDYAADDRFEIGWVEVLSIIRHLEL